MLWIAASSMFAAESPFKLPPIKYEEVPLFEILRDYETVTETKVSCPKEIGMFPYTLELLTPEGGYQSADEWRKKIEASLFCGGLLMTEVAEGKMKVSAWGGHLKTSPLFFPEELPDGDILVQYLMRLEHISVEEASKIFAEVVKVDGHRYGKIEALPKAKALLITEESSIIKKLVSLQKTIDIGLIGNPTEVIQFKDNDVVTVAVALNKHVKDWSDRNQPIVVHPDERTNRLIVRASAKQMKAILTYLEKEYPELRTKN